VIPIHAAVLTDGRVLVWSRLESPHVWDPAKETFLDVPSPSWIFCAGLTHMPDGQVIVPGGHLDDDHGIPDVNLFDPVTSTWTKSVPMAAGRWYPSAIQLGDGSILVAGGAEQDSTQNPIAEVRNADGTWRELTGASLVLPYFPWLFLAPDGRVFMAGFMQPSRFLDTNGTGRWITGPAGKAGIVRPYGSPVMYEPGKVLVTGGGETPPTNTAEVIDLNSASPAWHFTSSMAAGRRQHNATLLPNGKVLVIGGTSGTGFNDEAHAVSFFVMWTPATEKWTQLPGPKMPRVYHSTALLMPDGRVFSGGGGEGTASGTDQFNIEMYSPAYLFNADGSPAARPSIASAPDSALYGASISISSPDAASISRVTLVRLSAVTHAFNTNQRFVPVQFTAPGDGTLSVSMPANPNLAPPGHYLLFILNKDGVPSIARTVRLDLGP